MLITKQFRSFLIAGAVNTLFFYTLYSFLVFLGFHYYIAILGANSIGVIFSFKNFGHSVFDSHDNQLIWRFAIAYLFLIAFYTFIVYLLKILGIDNYMAGLFALIPHVPLSYMANKKFVYAKKDLIV